MKTLAMTIICMSMFACSQDAYRTAYHMDESDKQDYHVKTTNASLEANIKNKKANAKAAEKKRKADSEYQNKLNHRSKSKKADDGFNFY